MLKSLISGNNKSCGCFSIEYRRIALKKINDEKDKHKSIESLFKTDYGVYKNHAKEHNRSWNLSLTEFTKLVTSNSGCS